MPDHPAKWSSFQGWSGVSIRGDNAFSCPVPAEEWDVVASAITRPEGGAYDTVVSYDGTALTWGFAQWTFTSLRLQKLLGIVIGKIGLASPVFDRVRSTLQGAGLTLAASGALLGQDGKPVVSKDRLRDMLTPPGGKVPRTGKQWDLAAGIAVAFHELGKIPAVVTAQRIFLAQELRQESIAKRPPLNGKSISQFLYEGSNTGHTAELIAARALFWAMWQNNPVHSYQHILAVWPAPVTIDAAKLKKLAGVFARSQFGFWGNEKCANLKDEDGNPTPRESRYHKVATEINRVTKSTIFDPDLR